MHETALRQPPAMHAQPSDHAFHWHPIEPPGYGVHFRQGRVLIGAVTPWRGRWISMVNLHASALRIRHAPCASLEQGMRWVERWAAPMASHKSRSADEREPVDGAKARIRPPVGEQRAGPIGVHARS